MAHFSVEEMLKQAGNSSYKLVRMVAARALEIGEGGAKLVEAGVNEKPATTAMREIIAGRLMTKDVADAAKKALKASKGS